MISSGLQSSSILHVTPKRLEVILARVHTEDIGLEPPYASPDKKSAIQIPPSEVFNNLIIRSEQL